MSRGIRRAVEKKPEPAVSAKQARETAGSRRVLSILSVVNTRSDKVNDVLLFRVASE